jgi:hypothetical protein
MRTSVKLSLLDALIIRASMITARDAGAEQFNGYYTHFCINLVLGHLQPSVEPQSFLEWIRTSFEQPLVEFYTILLEEHLQVALEMLEVGFCSSI